MHAEYLQGYKVVSKILGRTRRSRLEDNITINLRDMLCEIGDGVQMIQITVFELNSKKYFQN